MRHGRVTSRRHQNGAVLMIALIFLVILTLLGLSAMDTTIIEVKLARNLQERNCAFQMAETVISESDSLFDDAAILFQVYTQQRLDMLNPPAGTPAINANIGASTVCARDSTDASIVKAEIESDPGGTGAKYKPELEFKGEFNPPRLPSISAAYSMTEVSAVYYETTALARNTTDTEGREPIDVVMRSGYRRIIPRADD